MVVFLYPDISNFTFQNVKNLKYKNFLIDFLDELGNLMQKNFYTSKLQNVIFFTFYNNGPIENISTSSLGYGYHIFLVAKKLCYSGNTCKQYKYPVIP